MRGTCSTASCVGGSSPAPPNSASTLGRRSLGDKHAAGGTRAANANVGSNKDGPNTVISPINGENDVYSLLMGPTFTVMTPSLLDVPTQPRLFFDLSILAPATLESPIARNGDPGGFGLPRPTSTCR